MGSIIVSSTFETLTTTAASRNVNVSSNTIFGAISIAGNFGIFVSNNCLRADTNAGGTVTIVS